MNRQKAGDAEINPGAGLQLSSAEGKERGQLVMRRRVILAREELSRTAPFFSSQKIS